MSDVEKDLNALQGGAGNAFESGSVGADPLRCPACGSPLDERHQTGAGDRAAVMADLGVREVKLTCPACGTVCDVTLPRGFPWKAAIDIPNWGVSPADTGAPENSGVAVADWYPDPLGHHEYRYWDGASWTPHVADRGTASTDPLDTATSDAARPSVEQAPADESTGEPSSGSSARTADGESTPDLEQPAAVAIAAAAETEERPTPDLRRVETLRFALRDRDWQECERAARSLDEIGWEPHTDEDRAWYLAAAGRRSPSERWVAVAAAAVEPLTFALQERYYGSPWPGPDTQDDWNAGDRRMWAAEALGEIGDARALPALIEALDHNDQNGQTAAAAADALGKIGDERAVEPLVSRLNTVLDGGYAAPAEAAATALGRLGGATAIAALIAAVDTVFTKPGTRVAAARALLALEAAGRLDGPEAQALSELRARNDWPV